MPVVYRDDESPAWGMMAILCVVAIFALMIGYFTWWRPSTVDASPRDTNTTIVQPSAPAPSPSPTIIPVPGPAGPAGPAGAPGPSGPSGPAGQSAPAPAPSDSGASSSSSSSTP